MILVLADYDPIRLPRIFSTVPLVDGLECYVRILQRRAAEDFQHQQSLYVAGGLKKAPKPAAILKWAGRTGKKRKEPSQPAKPQKPEFIKRMEREG